MKKYLALISLVLGFTACMNSENNSVPIDPISADGSQVGQLQLVAMKGLHKVSTSTRTTDTSTSYMFDLDTANSSIEQYFLLQNTGNYDVKHVTLTTNNSHFYFSPSEIDVVSPSKTAPILQLVKLYVIHGIGLNGVGPDSLLPMGSTIATARLSGSTTNFHHDSIGISQEAQVKVYAKVLDVAFVREDLTSLDMSKNSVGMGGLDSLTSDWYREFYAGTNVMTVVNTGNASFQVTVFHSNPLPGVYNVIPVAFKEIMPGDTADVSLIANGGAVLQIDGHGVVSNSAKTWLQPATNGKVIARFYASH